jgi:hypothetical protein
VNEALVSALLKFKFKFQMLSVLEGLKATKFINLNCHFESILFPHLTPKIFLTHFVEKLD